MSTQSDVAGPSGADAESKAPIADATKIQVMYATNRKWTGGTEYYSADFADPNHGPYYETGSLDVVLEADGVWRPANFKRTPKSVEEPRAGGFQSEMQDFLHKAKSRNRTNIVHSATSDALVFIHGFNTPFIDGITTSLGPIGVGYGHSHVMAFCWPSKGQRLAFAADMTNAYDSGAAAEAYFRDFLAAHDEMGADAPTLDILVHSMGHRVLSAILRVIKERASQRYFRNALLMAADEDWGAFDQDNKFKILPDVAEKITLYINTNDEALVFLGGPLSQTRELGAWGPEVNAPIDRFVCVDATAVATWNDPPFSFTFGHQYYRLSVPVMQDAKDVLRGQAPENRVRDSSYNYERCWIPQPQNAV